MKKTQLAFELVRKRIKITLIPNSRCDGGNCANYQDIYFFQTFIGDKLIRKEMLCIEHVKQELFGAVGPRKDAIIDILAQQIKP